MAIVKKVCSFCGSDDIRVDAWASWDVEGQVWEVDSVFDHAVCAKCGGETHAVDMDCSAPTLGKSAEAGAQRRARTADALCALKAATLFIEGFEGDELQEGIAGLLRVMRNVIAKAEGRTEKAEARA